MNLVKELKVMVIRIIIEVLGTNYTKLEKSPTETSDPRKDWNCPNQLVMRPARILGRFLESRIDVLSLGVQCKPLLTTGGKNSFYNYTVICWNDKFN